MTPIDTDLTLSRSEFLARYLRRHPEDAKYVTEEPEVPKPSEINSIDALKRHKYKTLLFIYSRRLFGMQTMRDECERLSKLADFLLLRSLGLAAAGSTFVPEILAVGKLGSEELNVSSDVDLIYFTSENSLTDRSARELTAVASRHASLLSTVTDEGFLYRSDLRLRPGGKESALVHTVESALRYYEAMGRTWERSVLLRARPISPEGVATRTFMSEIRPFIFPKHLSYRALDDLRDMKDRVRRQLETQSDGGDRNIKLGRGGIREVEFIVHAAQLIYGGRFPEVRTHRTDTAIAELAKGGFIEGSIAVRLSEAYWIFRAAEHALQWISEMQTHDLPQDSDGPAWEILQQMTPAYPSLRRSVKEARDEVSRIFTELFAPDLRRTGPVASTLPEEIPDTDETKATLNEFLERLSRLKLSTRAEQHLRRLTPVLVRQITIQGSSREALTQLLRFVEGTRARSTYFVLLAQTPAIVDALLRLFESSEYLADEFIRHPELLDTLVMRAHQRGSFSEPELRDEVSNLISRATSKETALSELRSVKREHLLRIALEDLWSPSDWFTVAHRLTSMADVLIGACATLTEREVPFDTFELSVVGMGSLGAIEMDYGSDLDLLFLVDGKSATPDADTLNLAVKWAQRFISLLSVNTETGFLYRVDARLRPSGNQGPLVTTVEEFMRYHETQGQLWERQSLLRARPVAGSKKLSARFSQIRDDICFSEILPNEKELVEMRKKMEAHLAQESGTERDVKTGKGGLTDVIFFANWMQLVHGRHHHELRTTSTWNVLDALQKLKLFDDEKLVQLKDGYLFLRTLENRLRLKLNQPMSRLTLDQKTLNKLMKGFTLPGDSSDHQIPDWTREYRRHTDNIRSVFETLMREA